MRLVTDDLCPPMNDPNERGRGPLADVGRPAGRPSTRRWRQCRERDWACPQTHPTPIRHGEDSRRRLPPAPAWQPKASRRTYGSLLGRCREKPHALPG